MDQRKEAVFRYIDEHRQEILDDWKALVNHEGSLRQPDAMHAEAEYLCGRFREAGVDCAVYSVSPEIVPRPATVEASVLAAVLSAFA